MDGQALFVPKFWNPSVFERGELALADGIVAPKLVLAFWRK
jgi:hypothetical protein